MDGLKQKMILMVATIIIERLDAKSLKKWADFGLDMAEDTIANSETELDDKLVLPVIKAMREAFAIEDND